jgi:hypothetical protein
MSKMTVAQKRMLIAKQMRTAAGRATLAASMNRPLREMRDYQSVGRRGLSVDPLADGALPYYDKDVDTPAFVVGEEGEDVQVVVKGERVFVPLFEIATLVEIPLTQIKQRRYDLQDRVKTKTKSEILREEDKKIFNLMSTIANSSKAPNTPITVSKADLTIEHFSEAMGLIEAHGDIRVANIFMNPLHNTVLRKINKDYYIDFETSKTLLAVGQIGTLYGATIHTSSEVARNEIYFVGEPEFTGTLVESQPLTVLSADNPAARAIGFSIFEQIGLLIHNPKAVSMIKIV